MSGKPQWVIEDVTNSAELIDVLRERKTELTVIPKFAYEASDFVFPYDDPVICHGSIQMAKSLRGRGFMFDQEAFRCRSYYPHYHELLLSQEYKILSTKDLYDAKNELYNEFAVDGVIFIKPDTNDKLFAGTLVEKERFDREIDYIFLGRRGDYDVVVSRPWKIQHEWRFFVAEGSVITGSYYRKDGFFASVPGYPEEAAELATEIAGHEWTPEPMFVVDICLSGDEYCLLEIGAWNCAGYYASDLNKIVEAAEKIVFGRNESCPKF